MFTSIRRPGSGGAPSIAFVVLATALIVSACGSAESFQTGQAADTEGQILFVADHNVMLWRDGDIEQLTEDVWAESPTWSPAGDRFAYVQRHEDFSEIVIAERDGDPLVQLTSHDSGYEPYSEDHVYFAAWAKDPDWSPVGEELVYVSDKGGLDLFSRNLYIWISEFGVDASPYPLDASKAIALSQEGPNYSPDGTQLVFSTRQDEGSGIRNQEIWTLDLEAGFFESLVVGTDGAFDPDWSPDGDNIAYIQRSGENLDVWIAPVDGSGPYQLTQLGKCAEPVWSPDGDQIAFILVDGAEFEVWVMDIETGPDGRLSAAEPEELFSADNIDATSGLSWFEPD
jgi:TolB protein